MYQMTSFMVISHGVRSKTQNWDEISPCCNYDQPRSMQELKLPDLQQNQVPRCKKLDGKNAHGFPALLAPWIPKRPFQSGVLRAWNSIQRKASFIWNRNIIWGRFHHGKKPRILDSSELRMWISVLSGGCFFITKPGLKNNERSMQLQVLEVQKASEGWLECGFGCRVIFFTCWDPNKRGYWMHFELEEVYQWICRPCNWYTSRSWNHEIHYDDPNIWPIPSMYGIFIYLHLVNVGKHTIHGIVWVR